MINLNDYILHDLTHSFSEIISGYSSSQAKTVEKDGWNARWLRIYSHAGTHMDAPFHFAVSNQTIDQFPPDVLMGKAHVVRIKVTKKNQLINPEDISGLINYTPGDSILLQTGWCHKINDIQEYRNQLPRISSDLAIWCVQNKVKILGVEAPSVADVNNLEEVTHIHRILFKGEVIIVEGLKNLDRISKNQVFLIALPLKIENGDGAPCRVIALEEKGPPISK